MTAFEVFTSLLDQYEVCSSTLKIFFILLNNFSYHLDSKEQEECGVVAHKRLTAFLDLKGSFLNLRGVDFVIIIKTSVVCVEVQEASLHTRQAQAPFIKATTAKI